MSNQKPIFVATHPRACSTAFERVFMTRRDLLKCVHEPFGDAWYFGPERLAERYAEDEDVREKSGFAKSTYQIIMERINQDNTEGKRLLIKDMAQYFFPQSHPHTSIAPSLLDRKRGVGTDEQPEQTNGDDRKSSVASVTSDFGSADNDRRSSFSSVDNEAFGSLHEGRPDHGPRKLSIVDPAHFKTRASYKHVRMHSDPADPGSPFRTLTEPDNPTVVPTSLLKQFHYAFLIRHPRYSIPSYYRCCIPPLDDMTGFHNYRPDEAGYVELRRFFDYCRLAGHIGPEIAGHEKPDTNGNGEVKHGNEICLIDADDLLDSPEPVMKAFCESVGIDWTPEMLKWNSEEDHDFAVGAFEKWKGFHEDAINSTDLKPRGGHHIKTDEELYQDWVKKYGTEGADIIKASVAENVEHYEYLKQFCLKV